MLAYWSYTLSVGFSVSSAAPNRSIARRNPRRRQTPMRK
jgi:hypothetical protein